LPDLRSEETELGLMGSVLADSAGNGADATKAEGSLAEEVPPEMRLPSPLPNLDTGFDIIIFEEQKALSQQILWWGLLSD
jgi:hypothetical protein